jgi:cellulose synthase/poly-beta-1,6-N-acetylglucosamine synthase-like glycosyltransferase
MSRTITVLTAVHPAGAAFFEDAQRSVLTQELPADWGLEWLVQEDSDSHSLAEQVSGDPRIRYACNGAQLGAAATRNLALARATGEYLHNLDADDLLLPGALATLVAILDEHPSVHWAFGRADDLMPDGSRVSFPPWMPPYGLMPAGRMNAWVADHGGNWPIPCAGTMYRTATLRAVGGWVALPIGEDIAMLAALSQATDGWQDPALTWLYRQHPAQVSRHPQQAAWSDVARRVALQRAAAARLTTLQLTGTGVDPAPLPAVAPAMKMAAVLPSEQPSLDETARSSHTCDYD